MSKNKLSLIAVVAFFALFAAVIFYFKEDKAKLLAPQAADIREQMLRHPGVKLFDQGAYEKIKNVAEDKACDFPSPSHQLMCLEGYYFVNKSQIMNQFFQKPENKQKILPVSVKNISEALGTGIALSLIKQTPLDIEVQGPQPLMKYIYDGWGQREAIFRAFNNIEAICTFEEPYQQYCLFGVGRAMFFLDIPFDSLAENHGLIQAGYRFARIFGGEMDPLDTENPVEKLALLLKNKPQSDWDMAIDCGTKSPSHAADCHP